MYRLYTDGSSLRNPGPGGWAFVMLDNEGTIVKEGYGCVVYPDPPVTNNQMEMTAAIKGLEAVPANEVVILISDSRYLLDGLTKWSVKWVKNNWTRTMEDGTTAEVKNSDLWKQLVSLKSTRKISAHWIKGHKGEHFNERCDYLARFAIEQARLKGNEKAKR
jgi:ribonuclease HI